MARQRALEKRSIYNFVVIAMLIINSLHVGLINHTRCYTIAGHPRWADFYTINGLTIALTYTMVQK